MTADATHNSLISGVDGAASSRAILDVLAAVRAWDDEPMSAPSENLQAQASRPIAAIALDGRPARTTIATAVIGGYIALGLVFRLGAEAYLLLGIPITIGFQILVVRRPLRSLWLRTTPPMTFTPRSMVAIVLLSIAPAIVGGVRDGDPALIGFLRRESQSARDPHGYWRVARGPNGGAGTDA